MQASQTENTRDQGVLVTLLHSCSYGNSAYRFGKIRNYALMRMALFTAKRARRSREFGWAALTFRSPDQLGLITLSGIVVAPYPFKDWRVKPNAAGERRR